MTNNHRLNIKYCLNNFPLRLSITDFCNLRCFFCSNEGMALNQKNSRHVDFSKFTKLIKILADAGLKKLAITGGDPTLHPKIDRIVGFLNRFDFEELYFHTNGINLSNKLINNLAKKFTKVSISIHSVNFETWKRITNGNKEQFDRLFNNIKIIANKPKRKFILELKYVPIRGVNDSVKEIKNFLDLCNNYKSKFKFLNFEPIKKGQLGMEIPISELVKKIIEAGGEKMKAGSSFRGQKAYLPIIPFCYNECRGVAIEIGCGEKTICKKCYKSNEIFVNPNFEIKPCHIDQLIISLAGFIKQANTERILNAILTSRDYLFIGPGKNNKYWLKDND